MILNEYSKRCLVAVFATAVSACSSLQLQEKLVVDENTCEMFVQSMRVKKDGEVVQTLPLAPTYEISQRCLDRQDVQKDMDFLVASASNGDKATAMVFMEMISKKDPEINSALQSALVRMNVQQQDIQRIAEAEAQTCTPQVVRGGGIAFTCAVK